MSPSNPTNQVFGLELERSVSTDSPSPFAGARRVDLPDARPGAPPRVGLFAYPGAGVRIHTTREPRSYTYLWGPAVHPHVDASDTTAWCSDVLHRGDYQRFRELLGSFVVVRDEPTERRISFVTDILGIRPMFVGRHNESLVFGSNIWPLVHAGFSQRRVDYDAVSCWITYGCNFTDGTIVDDFRRLPPGHVVTFTDGQKCATPYVRFEPRPYRGSAERLSEEIHEAMVPVVRALLASEDRVSLALSGGFDSRYLLALIVSLTETAVDSATVSFSPHEGRIARQVADALGVSLRELPVVGSVVDFLDPVFRMSADGFPIGAFVIRRVAEEFPGLPLVNGFLGGIIHGGMQTFHGKHEMEMERDLVDVLHQLHLHVGPKLFRNDIAQRIQGRNRVVMGRAVAQGSRLGKALGWTDVYYRQRSLISHTFVDHLDLAEAVVPFYCWRMLQFSLEYDSRLFSRATYESILERHFPALAGTRHAGDFLPRNQRYAGGMPVFRVARQTRQWARDLVSVIRDRDRLTLLNKKRCLALALAGVAGLARAEPSVRTIERLRLLEQRLRDSGVDFDWERF